MTTSTTSQTTDNPILRYWRLWVTPRSADRDEAFRENTIRVTTGVLIIVFAVGLLLQIAVVSPAPSGVSYVVLILVTLLGALASAIAVVRGQTLIAGYFLTIDLLLTSLG